MDKVAIRYSDDMSAVLTIRIVKGVESSGLQVIWFSGSIATLSCGSGQKEQTYEYVSTLCRKKCPGRSCLWPDDRLLLLRNPMGFTIDGGA